MNIEVYPKGGYMMIRISDPLKVISELTELKALIEGYLSNGINAIAVNFRDASYLYSGAISVLVNCFKMVRDQNGDLCIVEPQAELLELLRQMNIDSIISIYSAEDDLPDVPPVY
jgi:anti-anti-sigma factor